ncbi:Adenylate cyclase 1 [Planctomycetes bacterium Pan216]|uniref:Adenylate cyclase 1 n=1 Tax=Kolteria novifilia TaxID=2527975 RepID=A0A518B7U9_9BACT|nr:Adenylate cyclase 1 [Planctomycetes bacterium Pan216]
MLIVKVTSDSIPGEVSVQHAGPIVLGRRRAKDPVPPLARTFVREGKEARVIISNRTEISRTHLVLRFRDPGRATLLNAGVLAVLIREEGGRPTHREIESGRQIDIALPARLQLLDSHITVEAETEDDESETSSFRPEATRIPFSPGATLGQSVGKLLSNHARTLEPIGREEDLRRQLNRILDMVENFADPPQLFASAAKAVEEEVDVDFAQVVLWHADRSDWEFTRTEEDLPTPSQTVLNRARESGRLISESVPSAVGSQQSMAAMDWFLVAPLLDSKGTVIGVLYSDRRRSGEGIDEGTCSYVTGIASIVSTALEVIRTKERSAENRARFEQFFTKDLAVELDNNPEILDGQDLDEVTFLFCDIRGSSRICERLDDAKGTIDWIRDIMTAFSNIIMGYGGVVADFRGDEVLAMWGAPKGRDDDARRACLAATEILLSLKGLNRDWYDLVKEELRVGIGLNTGRARVGNIGSRRKVQYGPVGDSVNRASRVQGATKFWDVPLLVTDATLRSAGLLGDSRTALPGEEKSPALYWRRLGAVRVVNISQPINLFELSGDESEPWLVHATDYEAALTDFEEQRPIAAIAKLARILADIPEDGPAGVLLSRCARAIEESSGQPYDPVWTLTGK